MKKTWSRLFIITLLVAGSLIAANYVSAQLNDTLLTQTKLGDTLGVGKTDLKGFINQVAGYIFGFLGAVFTALIVWAGAQWMTAGGDEKKVETAKTTLRNSIIGVIIVICSYAISIFVINAIGGALSGTLGNTGNSPSTVNKSQ